MSYLWSVFFVISNGREKSNVDGAKGLTYKDIVYYLSLPGNHLNDWEISVIMELDKIYMKVLNNG